ncbi:hypothetical protein ACJIZ3_018637 [Penstemon smallii]|uniref:Transmembrane protein n=1 Tax=Penstemon smallii TaxID=265156 RepID=A0ABD3SYZ6_9LAMI
MSSSVSLFSSIATTASSITRRPTPMAIPCAHFSRLLDKQFTAKKQYLRFYPANYSQSHANEPSDFDRSFVDKQGSNEEEEKSRAFSSNEILKRLKRYGIAGILSYGLLNTAYYLTTFLVVWFYVTPAPGKMGYLAAVERFLKVMAMVWAGSQVTKIVRAGGALALAPFVDRGLSWFTGKFGFESQGKAFMAIAGLCFGLAFLLFIVVTLLSA